MGAEVREKRKEGPGKIQTTKAGKKFSQENFRARESKKKKKTRRRKVQRDDREGGGNQKVKAKGAGGSLPGSHIELWKNGGGGKSLSHQKKEARIAAPEKICTGPQRGVKAKSQKGKRKRC